MEDKYTGWGEEYFAKEFISPPGILRFQNLARNFDERGSMELLDLAQKIVE